MWTRKFEEPIPLPDGRKLIRGRQSAGLAACYGSTFASLVSESGPTTMARLAFLTALNSNAQG